MARLGGKGNVAKKLSGPRVWQSRNYDLGRMALSEHWAAYPAYSTINLYVAVAIVSGVFAGLADAERKTA